MLNDTLNLPGTISQKLFRNMQMYLESLKFAFFDVRLVFFLLSLLWQRGTHKFANWKINEIRA